MSRVQIPADVDRPDRLLFGLTARQLAIAGGAGLLSMFGYSVGHRFLPTPVIAVLVAPLLTVAVLLLAGRRDGQPLDQLAGHALRYAQQPRSLTPLAGHSMPAKIGAVRDLDVGVLPSPVRGVAMDGVLDLGSSGRALVCAVHSGGLTLRAEVETEALLGAFGRWLHSLTGPTQLVVRTRPVQLVSYLAELRQQAGGLPHPTLEAAAREHTGFLEQLAAGGRVVDRELLLVATTAADTPDPIGTLGGQAEQARQLLTGAGLTVTPLTGDKLTDLLTVTADPDSAVFRPGRALPTADIAGPSQ